MIGILKTAATSSLALALTTAAASAQSYSRWSFWSWYYGGNYGGGSSTTTSSSVPEIDAGSGLLAVAAVLAALALVWEIKRRRA